MSKSEITEVFGVPEGSWVWCLHCQRCYKVGEHREDKENDIQLCHYPDCDGDAVADAKRWESIRDINPDYPENPERNKIYKLYKD